MQEHIAITKTVVYRFSDIQKIQYYKNDFQIIPNQLQIFEQSDLPNGFQEDFL